jgi:glycine cleavage system H lipoate-binding protein
MTDTTTRKMGRPYVFSMANDMCVWSRAGVIKPMKCFNAFDCLGCSLDKRVQTDFEKKQDGATAKDPRPTRLRLLMKQGKCRHMLSGRVSYSLCSYGYNCVKCPYDQMIEDTSYLPNLKEAQCDKVSGFDVARDYYYHYGHTWARVEYGGRVRVGIDDFASRLFGKQDEIELPRLGTTVGQNRPQAVIRRSGNEAETLSPVDGKVVAVNHRIARDAGTVNDTPYDRGWLMVIQPSKLRKNLRNLFFGDESVAWIDDEASRLTNLLRDDTEYKMAATGGEAIRDIYASFPEIGWDLLVDKFLG